MYTSTLLARLEEQLSASLGEWRLPADTHIELLTTSENATFLARCPRTGRRYVLRLHRPDYHSREEIESELAWTAALRADGRITTPAPLPTTGQSPVVTFNLDGQRFYAVAFEHLPGDAPAMDDTLPAWFEKLGALTATLHDHSRHWAPPAGFVRKRWHLNSMIGPEALWGDWRRAPGLLKADERAIDQAIEQIHRVIDTYEAREGRYGLIHADLRLANLLVEGRELAVIDFDDCGFCWYAFDFAAAISFFELDPLIPTLREAWIRGYRRVGDFDAEDVAALDTFIMIRRVMLSAWLATHADSQAAQALEKNFIAGTATLARAYLSTARHAARV
ncbi:phosphotransferase enzyme family protein [Halomonas sp. HMF6819]|uniref:phosphotransferase enzyme family protein n=1 Tax=Halomonas sp. HMF6819 TaxID=3373085 RepID=UPI003791E1B9